jgi:signal transduction histidine kinase
MKIKTQFHLLIAGIVLLPVLTVSAQLLMTRITQNQRVNAYDIPVYEEIMPLVGEGFAAEDWKPISAFISKVRPNTDITVFRNDMLVIYSTFDDFAAGEFALETEILSLIKTENHRYGYSFESPPWVREGQVFLLLRFDRDAPIPPNPLLVTGIIVLTFIILILAFVLIMFFFIAQSITQSVLALEEATRRIAHGELDLAVEAKGSNEITSLARSFNQMRLAIIENEQRRYRFIMGITHDLKTPLALIKGYAEAIKDGITDDPASRLHSVGIITAKVDQLEGMIDDLIDFTRLDTGEWRRTLENVRLAPFLTQFAAFVPDDAELLNRQVTVKIDLPEDLVVPMDERLANRALSNLVNNALRYTDPGGLIRILAYAERDRIIIEIADDGQGIHESDLPHIFDLCYRGTSSRREQGMGLGLSVVRGVIDTHGWEILVDSKRGSGSVFRIIIPRGIATNG